MHASIEAIVVILITGIFQNQTCVEWNRVEVHNIFQVHLWRVWSLLVLDAAERLDIVEAASADSCTTQITYNRLI